MGVLDSAVSGVLASHACPGVLSPCIKAIPQPHMEPCSPVPGPYLALWVQPVASVKPSSRQRTWAACRVKSSSQMVPHSPARWISTRPSKGFRGKPASRNRSPWLPGLFSGAVDGDGAPRQEQHSRHSNSPHGLHCRILTGRMAGKAWVPQRETVCKTNQVQAKPGSQRKVRRGRETLKKDRDRDHVREKQRPGTK